MDSLNNMPVERSAGAIIFKKNKKIEYLLLHYPSTTRGAKKDFWDFPKGIIEKDERPEKAATREIKEETGIEDVEFIKGFKEWIKYFYKLKGKTIFKIVTFYLAEAKTKKVKISWEHLGYKWLPYKKAIEQLTFENVKEVLEKANKFLTEFKI